ncbi:MAG: arsenic efflux protein [Clostridia bacterium]|nr:arsenic efflux protein [Clostridia bacterium]
MHEILHIFLHALEHTLKDGISLLPFLFLTYFLMELIEHTSKDKAKAFISSSGRFGPLVGGVLGTIPQCGFSAAIAGLYSGRVITLGTLFAIFLSTSDEMLPIMISNKFPVSSVVTVIVTKALIGAVVGFLVDLILKRRSNAEHITHVCEDEGCHCENGVLRSALHHTLSVFLFIFAVGFILEAVIGILGEDLLASLISGAPVISNIVTATIGLIPNCAASVVITELYIEGIISAGAMMSGLLVGAGMGTLVLFRTNKNLKENLLILLSLWTIGALAGVLLDTVGFHI